MNYIWFFHIYYDEVDNVVSVVANDNNGKSFKSSRTYKREIMEPPPINILA